LQKIVEFQIKSTSAVNSVAWTAVKVILGCIGETGMNMAIVNPLPMNISTVMENDLLSYIRIDKIS